MCKSRLFHCCLVALLTLLYALPASARSPHGALHAKERICDALKARGVTRGLHGLCVSYCEAHDSDSAGTSGQAHSHGKHFSRGWSRRSNHILAHYNRLKKRGDPEMPCNSEPAADPDPAPAPVVQVCPCWTPAQADSIDGALSDGSAALAWSAQSGTDVCGATPEFPYINEKGLVGGVTEQTFIRAASLVSGDTDFSECQYYSLVGGGTVNMTLSIRNGNLTAEQLNACLADVIARQGALGVCQSAP